MKARATLAGAVLLLTLHVSPRAFGLAEELIGPAPKTHPQPSWAHGIVEVPRHASRVYSLWINGNDTFYFAADRKQVSELILAFSRARMRDHVVRLVSGEPAVKSFKGMTFGYNVSLHMLSGIALWHAKETSDKPEIYEPVLTIHVSGEEDRKALEEFDWPQHLIIQNEVADWDLKSNAEKPARKLMFAAVQFPDGKPATDYEVGMTTTIVLWEKGDDRGFDLGRVSVKGEFDAAFSLQEIARMKKGEMWLTMTVGNFLTSPAPGHPRLGINKFSFRREDAEPVTVERSMQYFGRLLFDDDSPPIMEPEAWPGGTINISFPYAGQARPDKQGYFTITLTDQQLEALKKRKPGKNIYVPLYGQQGRSRAMHIFPVDQLAAKKDDVVAFRIPKPVPPDAE